MPRWKGSVQTHRCTAGMTPRITCRSLCSLACVKPSRRSPAAESSRHLGLTCAHTAMVLFSCCLTGGVKGARITIVIPLCHSCGVECPDSVLEDGPTQCIRPFSAARGSSGFGQEILSSNGLSCFLCHTRFLQDALWIYGLHWHDCQERVFRRKRLNRCRRD